MRKQQNSLWSKQKKWRQKQFQIKARPRLIGSYVLFAPHLIYWPWSILAKPPHFPGRLIFLLVASWHHTCFSQFIWALWFFKSTVSTKVFHLKMLLQCTYYLGIFIFLGIIKIIKNPHLDCSMNKSIRDMIENNDCVCLVKLYLLKVITFNLCRKIKHQIICVFFAPNRNRKIKVGILSRFHYVRI